MRLKELRASQHLLQKDVAAMLGVDRTTYAKYESGASEPNRDSLLKMAQIFNVSTDYLLGRTDQKEARSPKFSQEITMDDFTYAMQNETKDLTDMDKQILLSMAKQLNQARRQNGETG